MIGSITTQDSDNVKQTLMQLIGDHSREKAESEAVKAFLKIYNEIDFSQINPDYFVHLFKFFTTSHKGSYSEDAVKQKAFRLFFINLNSFISIDDMTSSIKALPGGTQKHFDDFMKNFACEAFLAMNFTDRVDLDLLPKYMPIIVNLLPPYLDSIFLEKDGLKSLKLEKKVYVTFESLLNRSNLYVNLKINDAFPKEINLIIKKQGNPGGFEYDHNTDAYEFYALKLFMSKLSEHDVEMTDRLCNALLDYNPDVRNRLEAERGGALKQENEAAHKSNLNKAKEIISTLGFQRYRENQPLSNNVSTKPVIKEGRQRLETALEGLIKERLLPDVLDLKLREQIINSFENMESSNFTVKEIKKHLIEQLDLKVDEKPKGKPKV